MQTASEILAAPIPPLPAADLNTQEWLRLSRERIEIIEAKNRLDDELAYARVLARRLEKPDDLTWPLQRDDLRRCEWRNTLWLVVERQLRFDLPEAPTTEVVEQLAERVDVAARALELLNLENDSLSQTK